MRRLPTEVYSAIFEFLATPEKASRQTLVSACLCSKFLYSIAAPLLYRSLWLERHGYLGVGLMTRSSHDPILPCLITLLLSEEVGTYVRELMMRGSVLSRETSQYRRVTQPPREDKIKRRDAARAKYEAAWRESGVRDLLGLSRGGGAESISSETEGGESHRGVYDHPKGRQAFRDDYNKVLTAVLGKCTKLKSFWLEETLELNSSTIIAISALPLEILDIRFSVTMIEFWDPRADIWDESKGANVPNFLVPTPGYTDLALSPLANLSGTLKRLSLLELGGDLWRYVGELADVLIACRATLRSLEIGIESGRRLWSRVGGSTLLKYDESEPGREPPASSSAGSTTDDSCFWMKVCCRYARRTADLRTDANADADDARLKLGSLELCYGTSMARRGCAPFPDEVGEYLSSALDLKHLEQFGWRVGLEPRGQGPVGWHRLDPAVNLKELEVESYTPQLLPLLSLRRDTLEQLIIWESLASSLPSERELDGFYDAISSEKLTYFHCRPVGVTGFVNLTRACVNLEHIFTTLFGMTWRSALDVSASLIKLQRFHVSISLDIEFEEEWEAPQFNEEAERRADVLTDGLCSVNIIEKWRGYLELGRWKEMDNLYINADKANAGRWWFRRKDAPGDSTAASPRWKECVNGMGSWVDLDLDDPAALVKRPRQERQIGEADD